MPVSEEGCASVTLLGPPYSRFEVVDLASPKLPREGGWAMTWDLGSGGWRGGEELAKGRLAGIALVVILPETTAQLSVLRVLRLIERTRPQAVLPHHEVPSPREVKCVLRRPPTSLAASVTDYLEWRGVTLSNGTRRILRRTVELSDRVRTIAALASNLYISRRALGRRLLSQQLPVPSHWLQIARILRATIKLQNSDASLFTVASSLGYPDGFSLSNQMKRLCGVRPLEARRRLGWEWLFETWLGAEAARGTLSPRLLATRPSIAPTGPPEAGRSPITPSSAAGAR